MCHVPMYTLPSLISRLMMCDCDRNVASQAEPAQGKPGWVAHRLNDPSPAESRKQTRAGIQAPGRGDLLWGHGALRCWVSETLTGRRLWEVLSWVHLTFSFKLRWWQRAGHCPLGWGCRAGSDAFDLFGLAHKASEDCCVSPVKGDCRWAGSAEGVEGVGGHLSWLLRVKYTAGLAVLSGWENSQEQAACVPCSFLETVEGF